MKALVWIVGIVVLALTIVTIIIGTRTFEGTVVDKPYEAGLAWDAERANRAALGWSVSLVRDRFPVGTAALLVAALDRRGSPLAGAEVGVALTRPSTRAYDRRAAAVAQPTGLYLAELDLPLAGAWQVTISVRSGQDRSDYVQTILADEEVP